MIAVVVIMQFDPRCNNNPCIESNLGFVEHDLHLNCFVLAAVGDISGILLHHNEPFESMVGVVNKIVCKF